MKTILQKYVQITKSDKKALTAITLADPFNKIFTA